MLFKCYFIIQSVSEWMINNKKLIFQSKWELYQYNVCIIEQNFIL